MGKKVIRAMGEIARAHGLRAAVKFQFRDLDTFLHPELARRPGVKHVGRFLETRLSWEDFEELRLAVKAEGLLAACTPFDEASVERCREFDILKVASCSATDWPLLHAVRAAGKPVILSTAGLPLPELDPVVSFFSGLRDFSLMHCVALYPTPAEELRLGRIAALRSRYPGLPVGYSTHESPDELGAVQMAYALGARIFEKHVGLPLDGKMPNAYSASPPQVEAWVRSYEEARLACGSSLQPSTREMESLRELARGVFARRAVRAGERISEADVFFAIPMPAGALSSGAFRPGLPAARDYAEGEALDGAAQPVDEDFVTAAHRSLAAAGIHLSAGTPVEVSHHYGRERFHEVGAVLFTCVNRAYCKKLIVLQPGQRHPAHLHREKEETFFLLAGDLELEIEGKIRHLKPGDQILIPRECWHSFRSAGGAVIEEISTRHQPGDSYYQDSAIHKRLDRKSTPAVSW